MKCTSPCQPPCENEATQELLSLTGAHLGYNCEHHIKPLLAMSGGKVDYKSKPLEAADVVA